jgi:hypothetical protein
VARLFDPFEGKCHAGKPSRDGKGLTGRASAGTLNPHSVAVRSCQDRAGCRSCSGLPRCTAEHSRRLERPGRLGPEVAFQLTCGVGLRARNLACTLLVCAAFRLHLREECPPVAVSQGDQSGCARPGRLHHQVLGRTHLGSFPPCEDQSLVERTRSPPNFIRADYRTP